MDFVDLEKAYDRVNRDALWKVLSMYGVVGKRLSGINSLACVRVKGGESECFRIESGVRQSVVISPWFCNVYMDAVIKELKMGMGRMEVRFLEEGGE